MLAYILALAVGLGSLGIYLAAFFLPEVHRKSDFYWSGLGLFYALVLWVCAGRITGGVLLGQIASVNLLGWFGWQTLTLRRQMTPAMQQTELPDAEAAAEKVRAQAVSLKDNLQSKMSDVSVPAGVSQLPQRIGSLLAGAKDKIQERLNATKKPKAKPVQVKTTAQTVNPPKAATGETLVRPVPTVPNIEALDADSEAQASAPPTFTKEALDADSEADIIEQATAPSGTPATPELKTFPEIKASEAVTAIENFAPEVDLAPPAQPIGMEVGNISEINVGSVPIPEVTSKPPASSPFSGIAPSQNEEVPEPKRPNPPPPELVEEAVEDAQAKNLPTSPPSDKAG